MRVLLPVLVATAALVGAPRAAEPCSPPPGGVQGRQVFPDDGAVDVPTNARVIVEYDVFDDVVPGGVLVLRAQGGAEVAAATSQTRGRGHYEILTPLAPLLPSTTYEVLDTFHLDCPDGECLGDPAVIATFTTGVGSDTTPPALSGVTVSSGYDCLDGTTCEYHDEIVLHTVTVASAVDDRPWVFYEYMDAGGEPIAGPTRIVSGGEICDGGSDGPLIVYVPVPSTFRIRAVDLAGNVEATSHVLDGETCEEAIVGTYCDPNAPGGDAGPDGGSMADDGGGGGCDAGGGGSWALVALLLLLLGRAAQVGRHAGVAVDRRRRR